MAPSRHSSQRGTLCAWRRCLVCARRLESVVLNERTSRPRPGVPPLSGSEGTDVRSSTGVGDLQRRAARETLASRPEMSRTLNGESHGAPLPPRTPSTPSTRCGDTAIRRCGGAEQLTYWLLTYWRKILRNLSCGAPTFRP